MERGKEGEHKQRGGAEREKEGERISSPLWAESGA